MNLWFGKAAFILGYCITGYFRRPHIKRNRTIKVEDRKTKLDIALFVIGNVGWGLLPFIWIIFDVFSFADYPLYPSLFVIGLVAMICGLWLFKRSHNDLGTNWSISLEVKENHRIIKEGIYKTIRHPMYSALFIYTASQAFLLPNWIVGPAGIITFAVLFLARVKAEEKLMLDKFGEEYKSYMNSTKRLIPGIW